MFISVPRSMYTNWAINVEKLKSNRIPKVVHKTRKQIVVKPILFSLFLPRSRLYSTCMPTFYPFSIFHMAEFRERSVRRMRSLTVVWPEDRGCRGEVGALAGYISISRGGMSHPTGHTILTGSVQNY